MKKSREKLIEELKKLKKERAALLKGFERDQELAVGSVSQVRRKCGNPNCRCATGEGHLQTLFLFKGKKGARRCKFVRREDEKRFLAAGARYRELKKCLKRIRAVDKREKEILMAIIEKRAINCK